MPTKIKKLTDKIYEENIAKAKKEIKLIATKQIKLRLNQTVTNVQFSSINNVKVYQNRPLINVNDLYISNNHYIFGFLEFFIKVP